MAESDGPRFLTDVEQVGGRGEGFDGRCDVGCVHVCQVRGVVERVLLVVVDDLDDALRGDGVFPDLGLELLREGGEAGECCEGLVHDDVVVGWDECSSSSGDLIDAVDHG